MSRPFLRILIPYLTGCILAIRFDLRLPGVGIVGGLLLLTAVWAVYRHSLFSGWWLWVALLLLGLGRTWIAQLPTPAEAWLGESISFDGYLSYRPDRTPETRSAILIAHLGEGDLPAVQKVWLVAPEPLPETAYGAHYAGRGVLERPSGPRNPGGYDMRRDLARRGIRLVLRAEEFALLQDRPGSALLHRLDQFRQRVETLLDLSVHGQARSSAVIRGMLLGERHQIAPETLQPILESGLLHLFAVSGLHVGFVAVTVYIGLGFLRILPERPRLAITMAVTLLYAGLVGFHSSAIRAAWIVQLVLFARWVNRDADLLNLLALAAFGLLVWNPLLVLDYGFQLSFLVTGAIIALVGRWWGGLSRRFTLMRPGEASFLRKARNLVIQCLLVTFVAQVAAQPLIGYIFHRIYPASLVANLLAAWLAWWIIVTSLLCILGGLIWSPIASILGYSLEAGIAFLIGWSGLIAGLPAASLMVTHAQSVGLFLLSAVVLGLTFRAWLWQAPVRLAAAALVLPVCLWWGLIPRSLDQLRVTFLDVGQGDCAVIRTPGGKVWLIDTGPRSPGFDAGERIVAPYLLHENIRAIDTVLITHPESDHRGGLKFLRQHFKIGRILGDGRPVPLGSQEIDRGIQVEFLHPSADFLQNPETKINERSVVVRLSDGEVRFLFTGDVEGEGERALWENHRTLRSTVLKVAHHGSKTSSSRAFLEAVSPRIAVISCGHDPEGHFPNVEVLTRLRRVGTTVFRTDQMGAIRLTTDGTRCWRDTSAGFR